MFCKLTESSQTVRLVNIPVFVVKQYHARCSRCSRSELASFQHQQCLSAVKITSVMISFFIHCYFTWIVRSTCPNSHVLGAVQIVCILSRPSESCPQPPASAIAVASTVRQAIIQPILFLAVLCLHVICQFAPTHENSRHVCFDCTKSYCQKSLLPSSAMT